MGLTGVDPGGTQRSLLLKLITLSDGNVSHTLHVLEPKTTPQKRLPPTKINVLFSFGFPRFAPCPDPSYRSRWPRRAWRPVGTWAPRRGREDKEGGRLEAWRTTTTWEASGKNNCNTLGPKFRLKNLKSAVPLSNHVPRGWMFPPYQHILWVFDYTQLNVTIHQTGFHSITQFQEKTSEPCFHPFLYPFQSALLGLHTSPHFAPSCPFSSCRLHSSARLQPRDAQVDVEDVVGRPRMGLHLGRSGPHPRVGTPCQGDR